MDEVRSKTAEELFGLGGDYRELGELARPRLTQPQLDFCSHPARKLLWRGGNSIGKSYGHAFQIIQAIRCNRHFNGPIEIMLAGYSFAQMDPLLSKLWSLLPKGEIAPQLYRVAGQGIRGFKEPVIPFVAGPGAGSTIYLATYKQGPERIQGFQGHQLSFDEPPPEDIYREAQPRLNSRGGFLRVTMTPTPDSPPLEYMRKEVDEGRLTEMQTSYNLDAITLRGGLVSWAWKTQAGIDADIAAYAEDERAMRRDGAWDQVVTGRALALIDERCWVDGPFPRSRHWRIGIGVDHGTRPGRQSASLVMLDAVSGEVWILDEHRTGEVSSTSDDARGILAMLKRNGIPWTAVDLWVGDRATRESQYGIAKCNADLFVELASELRLTGRAAKEKGLKIKTAFKNPGSPRRDVAKLNTLAQKGLLKVHAQAKGFREAVALWRGDAASAHKDPVDSARYPIMELLRAAQGIDGSTSASTYIGV